MKRLEFHISYICNHHCIFCSEDDRMKAYKDFPLSRLQIKTILLDRRKKWYDHVNFTWGEATLFPKFLDILQFAKEIWYKIYVWTNGTLFSSLQFSEQVLNYIDELSLSVHWFDQVSCFQQTGHQKHFLLFPHIVENIKKFQRWNYFFCNIVLNQYNYWHILDIIKFIVTSGYPVKQILISTVAPEWIAKHSYWKLTFDLYAFQSQIPQVVEYCNGHGIILRFFWLPTCILGEEYKAYANDAHWEERHTIERFTAWDGKVILKDIYSPDNSRERSFVDKCYICPWKANPCTWVFSEYLKYYSF